MSNKFLYRIGTEERNIFGVEIKANVSPGPAKYNSLKALDYVRRQL